MKKGILLFGSSGHARVLADIVSLGGTFHLAGVLDDFLPPGTAVLGSQVVGNSDTIAEALRLTGCDHVTMAVGHNYHRLRLARKLEALADFRWQSLVHPAATVAASAVVGDGTVIMAGAVVGPGCQLGSHCIVNTGATVDHDCQLLSGASVGPGAHLGGHVTLGEGAIVALGANVINAIAIGEHSLVGAGATVVRDIDSYRLAMGLPATIRRQREAPEDYL